MTSTYNGLFVIADSEYVEAFITEPLSELGHPVLHQTSRCDDKSSLYHRLMANWILPQKCPATTIVHRAGLAEKSRN